MQSYVFEYISLGFASQHAKLSLKLIYIVLNNNFMEQDYYMNCFLELANYENIFGHKSICVLMS